MIPHSNIPKHIVAFHNECNNINMSFLLSYTIKKVKNKLYVLYQILILLSNQKQIIISDYVRNAAKNK